MTTIDANPFPFQFDIDHMEPGVWLAPCSPASLETAEPK